VIEEAKRKHYDKKIQNSSNKCKATWDVIKELTNNQRSHPDIQELIIDNKLLKDQQDVTDAFNNYFSSVIDKTNKTTIKNIINNEKLPTFHYYLERNYDYSPPSLVIKTFSTTEITSIIKALKPKNSYGYDEISMKLLKISATYICSL
jgi:hypothetical protein